MTLDLAGVGIGPANLSLAALAHPVAGLRVAMFERRKEFRWHPGLLIEGATIQVPFLADLVTLADPTSPLSFLNYLRAHDRLFPFYFVEKFHMARTEYDDYCRWAGDRLDSCHFGVEITGIDWHESAFHLSTAEGEPVVARNVVLGVGTSPFVPEPLRALVSDPEAPVLHSADYLTERERLLAAPSVTVVGSGQSGAEVFLDLLRHRHRPDGLRWIARTVSFAPMEYSKLGLEQFTPDYTDFFHRLDESTRDGLLPSQWQLYKGIDSDTIAEIHEELYRRSIGGTWPEVVMTPGVEVVSASLDAGRVALGLRHRQQNSGAGWLADAVVCATGYTETPLDRLLGPLAGRLVTDERGRPVVERDHRLRLEGVAGSVYVQNAERHTHGVGAPDLGLAAWRAATILNSVCGREVYRLPSRTAFTRFGLNTEDE
ncbi:SidA/IucD/PvdA family monooxygenase [Amycolatopsis acidiphila]|uniref:L-lysine N6-monooxygenase MbtG n=1 Tax=Amycolatopsis acidiphila TaxID=715473 RepID=A0A558AD97_9PSEU|nr:SidA/IucD/PvdA family monooxygenase [Amycolatopsis acidiphila]TVT22244.1 lysine 6-monooxygenase [Amycolatopsis acidiphila]UIJ58045.1 SidA/IucD/PvdA family monooxygenase [Amycolatopsis acidiphila]GHG70430.1 lysine 6-monooxygenase [Amycolatopsis acidiphila]